MTEKKTPPAAAVKVRVIADYSSFQINDVVTMNADEAAAAVADGWADDHPSAVAYAESIALPAEVTAEA